MNYYAHLNYLWRWSKVLPNMHLVSLLVGKRKWNKPWLFLFGSKKKKKKRKRKRKKKPNNFTILFRLYF